MLCCALLLPGGFVYAQDRLPPQSLEEVIAAAFPQSLERVIAIEQVSGQKETKRQALYALFPQLSLTANRRDYDREQFSATENRTVMTNGQESETTSLSLSQTLIGGGAPSYGYVAAARDYDIALQNMRQTEIDILLKIITSYNNLYIAQEIEKNAHSNLQRLERHYQATEQRAALGSASQTELQQAAARLENGKAGLIQAQSSLVTARADFAVIAGKPVDFTAVKTDITPEQRSLVPKTGEDTVRLARETGTAITIARLQTQKAAALTKRAPLPFIPNLSIAVGQTETVNPNQPNGQTDTHVDLNLSYNLTPGRALSAYRQAKANLAQARHSEALAVRLTQSAAVTAWQNFISAEAGLNARAAARTASESAFQGTQTEYQIGRRSQLELLDAQDDLLTAEQNHIQAVGSRTTAYYRLMAQIGKLQFSQFDSSN